MGWFKRQFDILKQGFKDIRDLKKFKKDIIDEELIIDSQFNNYNLKRNKKGDAVYLLVDIPEDYEKAGDDRQKMIYLRDLIKPINRYFEQYLNWGEYLLISYYHYVSDNPDEYVYTYLVQWKFTPIALHRFAFWRNLVISILLIAAVITLPIIFLV